jgi:plastocyanin
MKKVPVAILLVLLAALLLAACGGSSSSESTGASEPTTESGGEAGGEEKEGGEAEGGGGGGTLAIEAAASGLAYASTTATAKAGTVTVDFTNPQSVGHDVAIEDSSGETIGETEVISAGESSTTVELEPGTYTFYCTVPGHREAGMEGTLTVK